MVAARIDYAKGVAVVRERERDGSYDGGILALEIYIDEAADGTRHLVHKPRGLTEIDVLRVLCELGNLDIIYFSLAEEVVHYGAYHYLVGGGRGDAATLQDVRGCIGVKAAYRVAAL